MLDQKVERFDRFGEWKRSLVFEVLASYVEQIRYIAIAERGARGIQDARSEKGERVFEYGHVKRVVFISSVQARDPSDRRGMRV